MKIAPLPKTILKLAKEKHIIEIKLSFSGGSDEGYLDVILKDSDSDLYTHWMDDECLIDKIRHWAWSVYDFSGAGDGNDFGDNIIYDLVKMQVTHTEWHSVSHVVESTPKVTKLNNNNA